jgi:hypothetical protein
MKCDFCKRDENEIKGVIIPIINDLQRQIKERIEIGVKDIYENYAEKNGFTLKNFEKVKMINEKYLKKKISSFLMNRFKIIDIDPNCEILLNYYNNYKPSINYHLDTLNDLMNIYLKEPSKERLDKEIEKTIEQNKKDCDIDKIITNNRIYHGYFPMGINFPFCKLKKIDNYIDIALCPHCLILFNISIADAIEAESKMKNRKIMEKESLQRTQPVGKYKLVPWRE